MPTGNVLAGNIIYAADVQAELDAQSARHPIRARSTVATTFTSNTTLGNITGLSCAVAANSVYKVRGRISVTGANTTHDLKLHFSLPASATIAWSVYGGSAAAVTSAINSIDMGTTGGDHVRGTFTGQLVLIVDGFITTLGTAGAAQLQGAQNTSDPGSLSFDAGSEISLQLWI